jgi:predicted alpha-1,6-mannanase (GH76 family)
VLQIFHDVVVNQAWNASQCGGGIQWCPKNSYKNAITNELFFISSMRLHPYAALLGKPLTYYLNWAIKEWQWFENSGMINNDYLINDGLRYSFSIKRFFLNCIFFNIDHLLLGMIHV